MQDTDGRHRFRNHVTRLEGVVQMLREQTKALETERDRLQEENQALRRELTQSRLINDLIDIPDHESEMEPEDPPTAQALYEALPPSCTFSTFFDTAERMGLDTNGARRCLRHFLAKSFLVQSGGQLTKQTQPSAA